MKIRDNKIILKHITEIRKKYSISQAGIAKYLGYKGSSSTLSMSMKRILDQKTDLAVWHINGIAEFLRYPVGYFLFGDVHSSLQFIDEAAIVEKIKKQLEIEKKEKTGKTKTKFGWFIGYAGDASSQINTTNRILKRTTKLRVDHLQKIADFFEKPVEWLFDSSV